MQSRSNTPAGRPYLAASDGRVLVPVEPSDEQLVAALALGDRSAAKELWDRHHAMVRRMLRRMLHPAWDIEDVVQDVFAAFFRRLGFLREGRAARSYLIGVTIRVAHVERRRRRVRALLRLDPAPVEQAMAPLPLHSEAAESLGRLLQLVGSEARILFALRYVEELQLDEMASALGTSVTTVKRKLARANAKIFALARELPELSQLVALSEAGVSHDPE